MMIVEIPGNCKYRNNTLKVMYHMIFILTRECKKCGCQSVKSINSVISREEDTLLIYLI